MRVLPEQLYERVMHGDEEIRPGEIFEAITKGEYRTAARSPGDEAK